MSGLFATKLRIVGLETEAISGTAVTLDASDFNVDFQDGDLSTLEVSYADDNTSLNGKLTKKAKTPGIVRGGMNLSTNAIMAEFDATGTSGSPTYTGKYPTSKVWKMAGFNVDEVAPTGLGDSDRGHYEIYSTKDSLCSTATIGLVDVQSCSSEALVGIEYTLRGCSSNMVITSDEAGMPFRMEVDPQGGVESVEEIVYANVPVFDEATANQTRSIPFQNVDIVVTPKNFDGTAIDPAPTPATLCVSNFNLDFQNQLAEVICASSQYGLAKTAITDQTPVLNISALMPKLDETAGGWNWWTGQTTQQIYTVSVIVYEDAAKTLPIWSVDIARAQLEGVTNTDNDGFRELQASFAALENLQGADETEKQKDVVVKVYAKTNDNTTP